MSFNPGDDFATVTDGGMTVTVIRPGRTAGTEVQHAIAQAIRRQEVEPSGGRYTAGDVVWHLPTADLPEMPRLGDLIVEAGGQRWTILAVQQATLGSRWRCVARNLAIVHGLDQYVDVEKAVYTKGDSGALEATWQPWRTGLRARIQPRAVEFEDRQDRLATIARFTIYLAENLPLDATHRIRGPDGTRYRIAGCRQAERIDALTEIDVVREQGIGD